MSAYNASNIRLSIWDGATPVKKIIARQTDCSFKISASDIDVTSKQSGRWGESLPGGLSGTITVTFYNETAPVTGEISNALLLTAAQETVARKYSLESNITGGLNMEVFAVITELDLNGAMNTGAGGSMTLKLTGSPTVTLTA